MNNNNLLHNISNITEADRQLLNELQTQLDNEMKKPVTQQNFDLIDEITETICEIRKENEFIVAKSRSGIEYLKKQTEPVCKKSKLKKWCTILGSCVAVVLALNVASISAFGKNVFSTAYQIVKGGINIDMSKEIPVTIKPYVTDKCTWVKTSEKTIKGEIVLNWTRRDGEIEINVTIPDGLNAHFEVSKLNKTANMYLNGKAFDGSAKLNAGENTVLIKE